MKKSWIVQSNYLGFVILAFFVWILNSVHLWNQAHHETTSAPAIMANYTVEMKQQRQQQVHYYSHTRGDRAGSAILDMLTAHAFSFHREGRYGGSCNIDSLPYLTLDAQHDLIEILGLARELPFACPPPSTNNNTWHRMLSYDEYSSQESIVFNQRWLEYIRSRASTLQKVNQKQIFKDPGAIQIVVHVRRGDVSFCHNSKYKRYLPNQYYLDLIEYHKERYQQKYAIPTPTFNISIYSNLVDPNAHNSQEPKESWDDFTSQGYNLYLGSNLAQTWQAMMAANVLIMSKSAFSHVPAMFNRNGTVVYTAYWSEPMPGWIVVPREQSRNAVQQVRKMARKECPRVE